MISKNQRDETMDNQQERLEKKIAWLTGIIEGEGWISLSRIMTNQKNKKQTITLLPNIGVANTDIMIIEEVRNIMNLLGIKHRRSTRIDKVGSDGIYRKQRYEVSCASKRDIKVLGQAIFPYMIGEKKNRLIKLFSFFDIRDKKPRAGKFSKYGPEEFDLYKELYSYKGKSRSRILNDYTPNALQA